MRAREQLARRRPTGVARGHVRLVGHPGPAAAQACAYAYAHVFGHAVADAVARAFAFR
ncbi:hypothetical protein RKD23_004642 [Streptomyces sp. SAI-170]|uniref:hypothetical protein n=1 Tax=Streptomyces sp. SAI-170 TaxID=3377729 RepID=UPI003C7C37BE